MRTNRHGGAAGELRPALFSFVTLRREAFGGILFNPFLPAEVELDEHEALMAAMCTGERTIEEIRAASRDALALDPGTTERAWAGTLAKLASAAAVQFVRPARRGQASADPSGAAPPARRSAALAQDRPSPLSAPKAVVWDVTYACNLSCPHCLTNSGRSRPGELDTREAHRLIDVLAGAKVLYLSLTGGEPFVRSDLVELLAHAGDTGMRLDIATNGFEVPSRVVRALRRLPVFQVQVSVDGMGEQHDAFRGRPGSFERACRTLRLFKDEGMSVSIGTTATALNADRMGELIDLAVELGCDGFKAIPFIPAGRGKRHERALALDARGCRELTRTLTARSRDLAGRLAISTESTFAFLLDAPPAESEADGAMICSAGHDQLSVGADGSAYPCPFLQDFPLGNLVTTPLERIWRESPVIGELRGLTKRAIQGPCDSCSYAPERCRGGCRASAFLATGSLAGSDPLCFAGRLAPSSRRA